ncbi:DUF2835 family protein [Pseudomonas sp. GCM10022186]|uniref:DUF2835 family protein n=1 Tax=Pseudomonas sp. GCM10022186 TaxID=3252650 RepID=UPI00360B5FA3
MPSPVLDISLTADEIPAVYQGRANRVPLRSRDGRRVSLPARHLRPHPGHSGVRGTFELAAQPASPRVTRAAQL